MAKSNEPKRILVELDALLDTRLGVLMMVSEEETRKIMGEPYYTRKSDDWRKLGFDLDPETYKELYSLRGFYTQDVMVNSTLTNMIPTLISIKDQAHNSLPGTPFESELIITINTFPYGFTKEEINLISNIVKYHLNNEVKVEIIHAGYNELDPGYIDSQWAMVILYNFNDWLIHHQKDMVNHPIPHIDFKVPKLYINDPDGLEDELMDDVDPFGLIEEAHKEFVSLQFSSVRIFSYLDIKI